MTIKGVTFDWWGTIAVIPARSDSGAMREFRIARLEALLRDRGVRSARSELLEAYDRQGELLESVWAEHRELPPDEQVRAFMQFAGLDGGDADTVRVIDEAIHAAIVSRPPATFPDIEGTLRSLFERGLPIGLISNTGRSWGRYLTEVQNAAGIGRYFKARIYSDELRVRKPDPRIFDAALDRLHLAADEVVHIGDDVVADVAGAKAVGMRAVWFNTGFWHGAKTDRADAEIRGHAELPRLLEKWR
jgi:putative hydrolase of the HAD superfamily